MNKNFKRAMVILLLTASIVGVGTGVTVLCDPGRGGGSINFSLPKGE